MNKIFIPTLIAFVLGFFSSRLFPTSAPTGKVKDSAIRQCATLDSARASLVSISENEYLEYTKIMDLKQKYEKADELLGKVMLLFLADVGFRVKKGAPIEQLMAGPAVISPVVTGPKIESQEPAPSNPTPSNGSGLVGKSSLIKALQSEEQIREFLNKAIIDNPKIEIAKGEIPAKAQIRILEGRYFGTIKFLDGKREDLNVIWDLMPDYAKAGLSGSFNLSIHGPGRNSETKGHGHIGNLVSLSEDSGGFLVRECGGECYLQLYFNSSSGQFFGNYYELQKGSKEKSERLGVVELKR